ncbi:halocyanin domain-containing protein [Halogeometricum borinquense]|uniref:Halocyanin domain-containing protein n=1 Tax=Halogeometricum borinquense TaxID=60847 RepID=A0A6C0UGR7_9EURY|nr:halocyanin domain-containing protein [Halogeometricum borinquense]QIB74407.1 halocyanin domain-containing protein [Halogeometricum borinquense]
MERDDRSVNRRTILRATGASVVGVTLAGCTGGGSGSTEQPENEEDSSSTKTAEDESGDAAESSGGSSDFGGWMDNVSNFESVTDATGKDKVTVKVGAKGNGGAYAFAPPAIRVSSGTTVVWEWTGKGSFHNVAAKDGSFKSEQVNKKGHTFEHTFKESGTYKYACTPHEPMGMKGVVVVE